MSDISSNGMNTADRRSDRRGSRPRRFFRTLSIQASLLAATLLVFDAIVFFALPEDVAARFPGYREGFFVTEILGRGYPPDYFEPHPERGFDIKATETPRTDQVHRMDEYTYRVWANKVGCFDAPAERLKGSYWYVAGDSIAWGHARHAELMSSVVEKRKKVDILKCGVTHTGQRHQFSKFLDVSKTVGRWPERVLVVYSPTDTANDYMHPHTTVVDRKLADIRMLDRDNNIVELDQGWFDQVRAKREAERPDKSGKSTQFSLSRVLLTYSMTAQLINAGLYELDEDLPAIGKHIGELGEEPLLEWHDKYYLYKGKKLYDLHRLTHQQAEGGYLKYADFPYADRNKAVIKEWRDHALANGYMLEFVLAPPGPEAIYPSDGATNFYKDVIAYLSSLGLKYYDLTVELGKRKINLEELYWTNDSHLSGEGNEVVGEVLAELL